MVDARPITRRRIRLINPNSKLSTITMPELIRHMTFTRKAIFMPTGLAVCAAVVPDHWQVEIVDECAQDHPHRPQADVDIVGLTAMTTQAKRAYELADAYRALGVTVFLGGIHPSALPDDALGHCDAICRGDGETCLPHMIADWEAMQQRAPGARLKRIYDWTDYATAPIASPRKDLLRQEDYLIFNPIQTTRGCPHCCNFCTTPGVFGRKFRQRRIADIVEEIREARERYNSKCYIFADDDFGGNHQWARELCAALEPLGIKWASQCDVLISNNEKLLAAMKRSGCLGLILGLESPNQETLTEAGKRYVQADTYEWRIRKIQSYGISLWGAFILGFDNDTWRTCMATCRFAQRTNLSMSCFPILTPYPGTGIWQDYVRQGRLVTDDWDRFNGASVCYTPRSMSARQLRHAQMAAFAEFYSLRSAVPRIGVLPFKKFSWLANLAIWRGIRYYYSSRGRQVPAFADFIHPHSRGWRYEDAWADQTHAERATPADADAGARAGAVEAAALNVELSDPLVQAAMTLGSSDGRADAVR